MGAGSFLRIKSKFEMRQNIKILRILKINWIKDLAISVVFNNGESRIIDFHKVLKVFEYSGLKCTTHSGQKCTTIQG